MKNKNKNSTPIKTVTAMTLAVIVIFFAGMSLQANDEDEKNQKEAMRDELKDDIVNKLSTIMDKTKKATSLYQEASEEAKELKETARSKLNTLRKEIVRAIRQPNVNKERLSKAKNLQKKAQSKYNSHKYAAVPSIVDSALDHITRIPIISLTVNPKIVTSTGMGFSEKLTIDTSVTAKNPIKKWSVIIYRGAEQGNERTEVKKWEGEGSTPGKITWNFKEDGNLLISSAEDYYVTMRVVDNKDGVAKSQKKGFETDIFTEKTKRGPVINVSSIRFDYNKANLKPQYRSIVKKVYDYLLEFPDYEIVVEGHTDALGSAASNRILSMRRAKSVARYLQQLGIKSERIETYGMGEVMPVTRDGKKIGINRRVSFILLKNEKTLKNYKEFHKNQDLNVEIRMENRGVLEKKYP